MIRLKYIFTILGFFTLAQTFAQGNYGGGVDEEDIHFGFTFQYISSEYKIIKNSNWRNPYLNPEKAFKPSTDSLQSIQAPSNPGFGVGFVANMMLTKNLDLRFTPTLAFTDRVVDYEFKNKKNYEQEGTLSPDGFTRRTVSAVMLDFPIGIKLKSERRNNFRAYVLGGIKYGMNIASKKKEDDGVLDPEFKFLKNTKNILSYEVGLGFDFYFEFFKVSPELKISNSINSVLSQQNNVYSNPIDKMYLRNFQFSLYFE